MAIYNPKRARELEAAARLAESQRQRELAKGQREQRTTEQILGLVEGLIGAAPQVASAFEQSQAERVLAGERPLEMEEAKDPFTSLGRFLFEPGIQRKVQQMAPERLAKGREVMKPLTTQEVTKGLAGKYEEELGVPLPPQMGAERAAKDVMEKVPAAKFVPEAQREALAVGDVQRVQAEQAAAERQRQFDEAKLTEMAAKAGTGKEREKKIKVFVDAAMPTVVQGAKVRRDRLASDVPQVANKAADEIAEIADLALAPAVERGDLVLGSAEYEAAKGQLIAGATKSEKKEKATAPILEPFMEDQSLVKNIQQTTMDRLKSKWSPRQEQIIQEMLIEGIDLFGLETIPGAFKKVADRLNMTKDQYAYYQSAMALRRQIMVELNGPGVLSNQDTNELAQAALNPWSTNEEWLASSNAMLKRIKTTYNDRLNAYNGLYAIPSSLISFADKMPTSVGEVETTGLPMGGTPKQQEAIAQRGVESVVKSFEPVVGAATALGAQGAEQAVGGISDIAKAVKQGAQSMFAQPTAAAPQTSQQQMQQIQSLPADYQPVNKSIPAGQFLIGFIDPEKGPVDVLVESENLGPFLRDLSERNIEGRILNNEMQGR